MPICPKCGAKINHLKWGKFVVYIGRFGLTFKYEPQEVNIPEAAQGISEISAGARNFQCPKCLEIICRTEEEALNFLQRSNDKNTYLGDER